VETSFERFRYHLRGPDQPGRKLIMRPDQFHRLSQWKAEGVRRARSTLFIAFVAIVRFAARRTFWVLRFGLRGAWLAP